MTNCKTTILFLLIVLISFSTKAQKKSPQLTQTIYSYTFNGLNNATSTDNLTEQILRLKGVTTCKPIIKLEQNGGQLVVVVEEYTRSTEGEEMFEPTDLKKLIINNGFTPGELTTETSIVQ